MSEFCCFPRTLRCDTAEQITAQGHSVLQEVIILPVPYIMVDKEALLAGEVMERQQVESNTYPRCILLTRTF